MSAWELLESAVGGAGAMDEDIAMAPVQEGDFDSLELFNATPAAKIVVMKQRQKTAAVAAASH